MKFSTIWTLSGLPLKERFKRTLEWLCILIGSNLPQRLKYWIVLIEIGKVGRVMSDREMGTITVQEVLDTLET